MPEGPSIVILREEALTFEGQVVRHVSGNAKIELPRLQDRKVISLRSWGKHFLICFESFFVKIHLLMFGSYRINEHREIPARMSLEFDNGVLNFYNCSVKILEGSAEDLYDWETDTMSPSWNPEKALKALQKIPATEAGDVLLDQNIFSGSGNIIKNEVLFKERIHPETQLGRLSLSKKKALVKSLREYCFDFYTWKKAFVLRKHWKIYRARECPVCHLKVTLRHTGQTDRRSFFCTHCQKLKPRLPEVKKKKTEPEMRDPKIKAAKKKAIKSKVVKTIVVKKELAEIKRPVKTLKVMPAKKKPVKIIPAKNKRVRSKA